MKAIGFCKRTGMVLLMLLGAVDSAHASLSWSWGLADWKPTVGPTDSIVLNASIYNDPSSTETITGASFLSAYVSSNEDFPYTFAQPDGGLAAQFAGMNLNPGESFDFVFGIYTPTVATVDIGSYYGDGFGITLQDAAGKASSWTPDLSYVVTVEQPTAGVPEPSSIALLSAGVGGIFATRRRFSI